MRPILSKLFLIFFATLFSFKAVSQKDTLKPKKYIEVVDGYLMVLRQGDNLFNELSALAENEKIPSANISGMGFAEAELGYFNFKTKKYKSKNYTGELASMQGTIAWQNGKPSIHAHGVITGKSFKAHGGHMLSAIVGTGSLEILVMVHDETIQRVKDEALGANILCFDNCGK